MRDDRGSAVAEFVMVSALLVALALAVVQLTLALHVRNTLVDAAAEGARFSSLADASLDVGEERTRQLIASALGDYPVEVEARSTDIAVEIVVTAPLPVAGLFGPAGALEVSGHAALEPLAG